MADENFETRLPPHDRAAERSVLGAMLRDSDNTSVIAETVRVLRAEHFYQFAHQLIFNAMAGLFAAGQPVDTVTLAHAIKSAGKMDDIGGSVYIIDLWDAAPATANVTYHAKIIRENAQRRAMARLGQELVRRALEPVEPVGDILNDIEQSLFGIVNDRNTGRTLSMQQVLDKAIDRINQRGEQDEGITGIPTGWYDLDAKTCGFQPGELVIVGARPSAGKTAFLVGCFRHLSGAGIPSLVFSLEQGAEEIGERIICADASVNSHRIRSGNYDDDDIDRMVETKGKLWDKPGHVLDLTDITTLDILSETRRYVSRHGVRVVFIDYLQLIRSEDRRVQRYEQVAMMTRQLKLMARELKIAVVVLAQLNRDIEQGAVREPRLSDLKESGSIEQDADTVLFIHKPKGGVNVREIIIAKQRNGPIGKVLLTFRGEYMRFENYAPDTPPEWKTCAK